MLEISLKYLKVTDDEIESLSLSHPVGANECGKSSVFAISQKPAEIALSAENKIKKERAEIRSRIAFLSSCIAQIDTYASSLSKEDTEIFRERYINKKPKNILIEEMKVSGNEMSSTTFSTRCQKLLSDFYDITPLTNVQMNEAINKLMIGE